MHVAFLHIFQAHWCKGLCISFIGKQKLSRLMKNCNIDSVAYLIDKKKNTFNIFAENSQTAWTQIYHFITTQAIRGFQWTLWLLLTRPLLTLLIMILTKTPQRIHTVCIGWSAMQGRIHKYLLLGAHFSQLGIELPQGSDSIGYHLFHWGSSIRCQHPPLAFRWK